MQKWAAERALDLTLTQHCILDRCQPLAPLRIAMGHLERVTARDPVERHEAPDTAARAMPPPANRRRLFDMLQLLRSDVLRRIDDHEMRGSWDTRVGHWRLRYVTSGAMKVARVLVEYQPSHLMDNVKAPTPEGTRSASRELTSNWTATWVDRGKLSRADRRAALDHGRPTGQDRGAVDADREWCGRTYSDRIARKHYRMSSRRQALLCPGPTSTSVGTVIAHCSIAYWQRVRNTQPEGGANGLGISPSNPA